MMALMRSQSLVAPTELRAWARRVIVVVLAVVTMAAGLAGDVVRAQQPVPGSGPIERGAWPSEGPPRPLASRDVNFPPYEIRTLPNGLQVVAVLHHENPVVSMRMIVRAGSALDPRDKLGMAEMTASLLTQGTEGRTATQLNEQVDFMGAAMGSGAGTDLTFLNMIVMKDGFMTGMQILSDMARKPAFAQEEIERQRQQMLSGLQVSLDDPGFIANAVFDRLVYGFHPYGMPETGTPTTLAAITREDIVAFHQRNFAPNNTILAVVGDVTADEAFTGVQKVFGDWSRREVPSDGAVAPPDPTRRVVIVDKPDAVQTEVRVGHLGIKRNHPDYMAVNLAIRILGGEGANRLHQVLRTQRALTYGAQADFHTLRDGGDIEAFTNTRSDATGEVLRLMVDEFWRLQRERVRERELADAKAYITGSFPLTIETPDAIATQVLNVLFYGLPVEELQTYRDRVNAVTVDDIERVAKTYLRPDRLSVVLVGNAATFAPQLKGIGFTTVESINMPDVDLTRADLKRAAGGAGAPAGGAGRLGLGRQQRLEYQRDGGVAPRPPVTGEAERGAKAILDRVIAAKGGVETLRGIKTITAITDAQLPSPAGPAQAKTTTYLAYPDRVRVETELPEGSVVQVFDGQRAWIKDPKGVHDVPDRAIQDLVGGLKRDTVAALLAALDGKVRARLLPDAKDDAGRRYRALELSGNGLEPMMLYVDPDTGLVAKQTYVAGGLGGALIEESFSDYKPVDGVQVAFSAAVRRGGVTMIQRKVRELRINSPLNASLFARPSS
jgi:zinc protease